MHDHEPGREDKEHLRPLYTHYQKLKTRISNLRAIASGEQIMTERNASSTDASKCRPNSAPQQKTDADRAKVSTTGKGTIATKGKAIRQQLRRPSSGGVSTLHSNVFPRKPESSPQASCSSRHSPSTTSRGGVHQSQRLVQPRWV